MGLRLSSVVGARLRRLDGVALGVGRPTPEWSEAVGPLVLVDDLLEPGLPLLLLAGLLGFGLAVAAFAAPFGWHAQVLGGVPFIVLVALSGVAGTYSSGGGQASSGSVRKVVIQAPSVGGHALCPDSALLGQRRARRRFTVWGVSCVTLAAALPWGGLGLSLGVVEVSLIGYRRRSLLRKAELASDCVLAQQVARRGWRAPGAGYYKLPRESAAKHRR